MHVNYANKKAKELNLNNKIKFCHGDACVLNFPKNNFSHILGIEGIANFNTRQKFFNAANRVLKKGGELIMTDIILGKKFKNSKTIHKLFVGFGAKTWAVPKSSWVNEKNYKKQLEDAGFEIVFLKKIGNKVFPGYAKYCLKKKTIKEITKERGFLAALGFSLISGALGFLYKKGLIEYIYIKAKKI